MKHPSHFFNIFALFALLVVSLGITTAPAVAAEPLVCIPTCSTTDGRMLAIASIGYETLSGQRISLKLAVPGNMPSFQVGIFDGDTSGLWDIGSEQLVYTLFADPTRTGDESIQLAQWFGSSMADNAWTDMVFDQDGRAMAPSGEYFYMLHITLPNASTITTWSNLKIRSDSPVELSLDESFAYAVPSFRIAEMNILFPNGLPTATNPMPSTFDGTWDMYFYIPTSGSSFVAYDGDTDHGSYDCAVNDTNDPDTLDGVLPPWVVGISEDLEGVAASSLNCRNSAGQIITGPEGQVFTTSNPSDDARSNATRRSPSITYNVIDPNGNVYINGNPSGNREWEQFRIDTDPNTPADYHVNELLPAGIYQIHVNGLDANNLNAWHLTYGMLCVYEDGTPCVPLLYPYKIGDTVFYDVNGNGTQDLGETGIAGVTVSLLDPNGYPIPGGTAVTDANGNYSFGVDDGTYTVQVDASNFDAGGVLEGYASTTGGNAQTNTVTTDNVLTYDFGFRGTAVIGDRVWKDLNGNGLQDADELGVEGVTVQLLGSDGVTGLGITTTDASGSYGFTNLLAGTYTVQFMAPAGTKFTSANAGADDVDSDVDVITGKTSVITLTPGQVENTIDAGVQTITTVNYCGFIRTPGFWKNYKNHMSDATFLNLIAHTQNFSYLTIKQALAILSKNTGITNMGIPEIDGVNARYLKFLLTAEINAVWNGQDTAATLGGALGTGIYQGTSLTVNQVLSQAYLDRRGYSSSQETYVVYLGATGEGASANSCLVQP